VLTSKKSYRTHPHQLILMDCAIQFSRTYWAALDSYLR
jgi:hypothetical protein